MDREYHMENIAAQMEELGFNRSELIRFLRKQGDRIHIIYEQTDRIKDDAVRYEVHINRSLQSGAYKPMNYYAELSRNNKVVGSHLFSLNNDLSDISTKCAYNLLEGRSVLSFSPDPEISNRYIASWVKLYQGRQISLPDFDYMSLLRKLPIEELKLDLTGPKLIQELISGDRAPILLKPEGLQAVSAYLEIDPAKQRVNIYDREGSLISLSVLLEKGQVRKATLNDPKQLPAKRKPGKNKGRSL